MTAAWKGKSILSKRLSTSVPDLSGTKIKKGRRYSSCKGNVCPLITWVSSERSSSLPSINKRLTFSPQTSFDIPEPEYVPYTRTFMTTHKGIVNKGDRRDSGYSSTGSRRDSCTSVSSNCRRFSLPNNDHRRGSLFSSPIRRQSSIVEETIRHVSKGQQHTNSIDSLVDLSPSTSDILTPNYRVVIFGDSGVGKTALVEQFTTADQIDSDITQDECLEETSVSVILNGEESIINIRETEEQEELAESEADAFIIVYSCADKRTFETAVSTVRYIRAEMGTQRPIFLVSNKIDLARQRHVSHHEGCLKAEENECKYVETSVALNHNVDELLVGVLSQIRHRESELTQCMEDKPPKSRHDRRFRKAFKTVFRRVFQKRRRSRCENIFEI